jgi:Ca2+-binding EF-hand superfamily protein/flagellar biosynthesis GTPase FlhF
MRRQSSYDKDGDGKLDAEEKFLLNFDKQVEGQEKEFPLSYLGVVGYTAKAKNLKGALARYNGMRFEHGEKNAQGQYKACFPLKRGNVEVYLSPDNCCAVVDFDAEEDDSYTALKNREKDKPAALVGNGSSVTAAVNCFIGQLRAKIDTQDSKGIVRAFTGAFTQQGLVEDMLGKKGVTKGIFRDACRTLGIEATSADIELIWPVIDHSGDGLVDLEEFEKFINDHRENQNAFSTRHSLLLYTTQALRRGRIQLKNDYSSALQCISIKVQQFLRKQMEASGLTMSGLFDAIDLSNEGTISRKELVLGLQNLGMKAILEDELTIIWPIFCPVEKDIVAITYKSLGAFVRTELSWKSVVLSDGLVKAMREVMERLGLTQSLSASLEVKQLETASAGAGNRLTANLLGKAREARRRVVERVAGAGACAGAAAAGTGAAGAAGVLNAMEAALPRRPSLRLVPESKSKPLTEEEEKARLGRMDLRKQELLQKKEKVEKQQQRVQERRGKEKERKEQERKVQEKKVQRQENVQETRKLQHEGKSSEVLPSSKVQNEVLEKQQQQLLQKKKQKPKQMKLKRLKMKRPLRSKQLQTKQQKQQKQQKQLTQPEDDDSLDEDSPEQEALVTVGGISMGAEEAVLRTRGLTLLKNVLVPQQPQHCRTKPPRNLRIKAPGRCNCKRSPPSNESKQLTSTDRRLLNIERQGLPKLPVPPLGNPRKRRPRRKSKNEGGRINNAKPEDAETQLRRDFLPRRVSDQRENVITLTNLVVPPFAPKMQRPNFGAAKKVYADAALGLKQSKATHPTGQVDRQAIRKALGALGGNQVENRSTRKLPKRIYTSNYPYTYGVLKQC